MKLQKYLQTVQKFSDEDLIKEYNDGLSDREMARRLGVNKTTIQYKRYKLGLITKTKRKIDPTKILNKKGIALALKKIKRWKGEWDKKYPETSRRAQVEWKKTNPEKVKEGYKKQGLRRKTIPELIEKRSKYNKKYYQEHKMQRCRIC